MPETRIEVVTPSLVAAGTPAGIRDFGRLLEALNNPAIARDLELAAASVRPLYRAASPMHVDGPLIVRRDEIIFATFEGPSSRQAHGATGLAPCLMLAPPFQIQGDVALSGGSERAQSLRSLASRFFTMRDVRVYDTEGYLLGEGECIVVNGAAVQMAAATKHHIEAFVESAGVSRRAERRLDEIEEPAPLFVRAA